jgi:hypothetical protein
LARNRARKEGQMEELSKLIDSLRDVRAAIGLADKVAAALEADADRHLRLSVGLVFPQNHHPTELQDAALNEALRDYIREGMPGIIKATRARLSFREVELCQRLVILSAKVAARGLT